jgi:uncharacterized protein (DUF2164 family)
MPIELPKEAKLELVASIRRYFRERLDDEIGDLKAGLMLDFCLAEICPTVYNLAIRDAQAHLQARVADLEGSCFVPEQTYWKTPPAGKRTQDRRRAPRRVPPGKRETGRTQ